MCQVCTVIIVALNRFNSHNGYGCVESLGLHTFAYDQKFALDFLFRPVQKRFFRPIRSVPGPLTNSISELPTSQALVSGDQLIDYRALSERHGPVSRVSLDELSFVSLCEEIYGFRVSQKLDMPKDFENEKPYRRAARL